ncbi:MAG: hypothetical protein ABI274_00040 [Ktedonobacterales bacterium]
MRQDHVEAAPDVAPDGGAAEAAEHEQITRIDTWLRANLGRRLVVALVLADRSLAPDDQAGFRQLLERFSAYAEVWTPPSQPVGGSVEAALRGALAFDADAILVWMDWAQADATCVQPQAQQLTPDQRAALHTAPYTASARDTLALAEQLGALDRCFSALIGPGVSRDAARALGYEDGFPADGPTPALIEMLGNEALARETYRRQGSSPPCYL